MWNILQSENESGENFARRIINQIKYIVKRLN